MMSDVKHLFYTLIVTLLTSAAFFWVCSVVFQPSIDPVYQTLWRVYFCVTSLFTFAIFMKCPGNKPNFAGDVLIALLMGWFWWPAAIVYGIKYSKARKGQL